FMCSHSSIHSLLCNTTLIHTSFSFLLPPPPRSTLFPYTTLFRSDGDSIAEGIGQGRVTKNIEGIKVDRAYRIPDQTGLIRNAIRSEEHTSELQSRGHLVCRLLLEKKKKKSFRYYLHR